MMQHYLDGELREMTPAELAAWEASQPGFEDRQARLRERVNAIRDRRMRSAFLFAGHRFDYDSDSQKRITGAAALAGFAMTIGGKAPDDLYWHDGATPFTWIAADNAFVQMDAQTVFAFGQAAGAWESAHIFHARGLKDAIDLAEDDAALTAIDIESGWPE